MIIITFLILGRQMLCSQNPKVIPHTHPKETIDKQAKRMGDEIECMSIYTVVYV